MAAITARLAELYRFWDREQTKAEVRVFILDEIYASLPTPPFTPEEKEAVASNVYDHVWQQAVRGKFPIAARRPRCGRVLRGRAPYLIRG